ncbi:MAG: PAS domain S-box protein [Deltaproteobacteria bacterium]|nr:PAS domain S-box protein [Deltaproteobacteria bacterium]
MTSSTFIGLINNTALLLALVLFYDTVLLRRLGRNPATDQILTGIVLGAIGIVVMLTSLKFTQGIVFDTRSVLLCISGLFFGTVPTLTAMLLTGAFRWHLGGAGMWMGIAVIFSSGGIGLAWRHFNRKKPSDLSFAELLLLGLAVHVVMLFWTVALPESAVRSVLSDISLPVLVIFPLATALFGKLLARQDERKQMENRLKESEARYRRIVETANVGIWTFDAQFRVTYVNHILEEFFGYDESEIIGRPVTNFLFEEDLADHATKMADRRSGKSDTYERRFRRKDGSTLWSNVSATPMFDESNRFNGAFAMFTDITDRKKAELELKESETRFRTVFEQAAVGVAQIESRTGRFVRINRRYCDILGYSLEEMMQKTFPEITHPDDLDADLENIRLLLKGEIREFSKEKRYFRKDGSVVWVNLTVSPMWAPGQEPDYHTAIAEDITQRKEAEAALRESEKILNDTGRMAKIGGWVNDLKTGKAVWTQALYDIIEIEGDSPPSPNKHLDYYAPEDRGMVKEAYRKCVREGEPFDLELRVNTAKGKRLWCRATGEPVFDDGECIKLRGTFQDITERKEAEEALKDEAMRRRVLFEQSRDGIVVIDQNGKVYESNRQYAGMLGYSMEEMHQLHVWDWDVQWTRDQLMEMVRAVDASGDHFETRNRRKDGSLIDVEISTNAARFADGKLVFCVCRDITGRKKDEEERKKYESQLYLAQKHEAIGTLAGGIAHDFNNILSSIIGFTELSLDDVQEGTELYQNLSEVLVAALRARDLVKQILTFTRQSKDESKPINICSLVKEVMNMLRATIPTSIRIETNLSEKRLTVNGDPTQIHQVIINLATNASHAMAENGGVMGITVESIRFDGRIKHHYPELEPGSYVRLSVSDTGHGIRKEHINYIFDPYFSTKSTDQGSGLGLAVVRGIVKAHRGHITVYSEVGKGTTFNVYLPLESKLETESNVSLTEKMPIGTEHILFVDDESSIVRMQKQSLERMGYAVTATDSSVEALDVFRAASDDFDLVITDMTMPGMTGDRLARAVKAIRPEIPVILCTGFSEKLKGPGQADMKIDAVLIKPVDKSKLAKIIRELLDRARDAK